MEEEEPLAATNRRSAAQHTEGDGAGEGNDAGAGREGNGEGAEVGGEGANRTEDVSPLCSDGVENSLFVWSKHITEILKQRDGSLHESQLLTISYLWEICDDLLLAKHDNVSTSPGFESL